MNIIDSEKTELKIHLAIEVIEATKPVAEFSEKYDIAARERIIAMDSPERINRSVQLTVAHLSSKNLLRMH